MPLFDWSLATLQAYLPPLHPPHDLQTFWHTTLAANQAWSIAVRFVPVDAPMRLFDVLDVTFNGYQGQPIKGWLILPKDRSTEPLPCVVEYIGYGGGRGLPHEWLSYAADGYAHAIMDTRGQGSTWRQGDTPDIEESGSNPQHPGFMTRGVLHQDTYYYRRVYSDAVRMIEAIRSHPAIDGTRLAVTGASQGGGIALAVAALAPQIALCLPDVPFLCHIRTAAEMLDTLPYVEIARFCQVHRDKIERVFETLAYFDGVYLAPLAQAQALFSVGLMDDICPPRCVYAAYNHYAGAKEIAVYAYNNHEGGGAHHMVRKLAFLRAAWG